MSSLFPTYGRWDLEIVEGKGTKVVDSEGNQYLDFISGIAVCNLGHRHPAVQKALENQMNKLWHVSNLFQISPQEEVAGKLTEGTDLAAAFFCNSGAEANEAAIKLARKHTGKQKIVTFKQSFHGRTFATMSATGQEKIQQGFGPLLEKFVYVSFNDETEIEQEIDDNTAAVMLEIVQGEGGVVPGKPGFVKKVEALCKERGVLLIIDEVQTGIGRTGSLFAFQPYNIKPDIVTLAKGLGSGFPVGAMLGTKELISSFQPGSHGSTFGGNLLAMAAAKATLDICADEAFLKEVQDKGSYLNQLLEEELAGIDFVKEIRGVGLMVGIECEGTVLELLAPLRKQGLLAVVAGPNVIRLLPPLTVSKDEIKEAVYLIKDQLVKTESIVK